MILFKHVNQNATKFRHVVVLNGMKVDFKELNAMYFSMMKTMETK